ncbi:MAG: UDP-N-acetylenolpyruvoylglucosamine reductase, partial [Actinobacteria bacterium]
MTIEENVPLGRLTTVGIGGPARHFARPGTLAEL